MSNRDTIDAALGRYVIILCDGAYDTEGDDAHLDVIALAYVMPPAVTEGWGAWPWMIADWHEEYSLGNRLAALGEPAGSFVDRFRSDDSFAATMVAKAIADGLDDELLILWYEDEDSEVDNLEGMQDVERLSDTDARCLLHVINHDSIWVPTSRALPKRKAKALAGRGLLVDDGAGWYGVTGLGCCSVDAHDELQAFEARRSE